MAKIYKFGFDDSRVGSGRRRSRPCEVCIAVRLVSGVVVSAACVKAGDASLNKVFDSSITLSVWFK